MQKENRRTFIRKSGLATAGITLGGLGMSAKSYQRIMGANDRIRAGVIGNYRRAGALRESFIDLQDQLHIGYVCDVVKERRENYADSLKEPLGYRPEPVNDLREVLADRDVDVIFNLTPDHWHAPGTWMALEEGKHVYVEKPLAHNPREGELLIRYRDKYNKVVQMGTQQRSQLTARKIVKEIQDGLIGNVYNIICFYSNQRGSIGNGKVVPVPEGFDWDLFQGPAPREVFKDIYFDYNWHWFWPWGTGETGNNATHELDVARWILQEKYPRETVMKGGKFQFVDDDWTMYDTMEVTFTFSGNKTVIWDGKSRNNYQTYGTDRGNIVFGATGSVFISRNGFKVFNLNGELIREEKEGSVSVTTGLGGGGGISTNHILNFLQAVRGKEEPHAPLEEAAPSTLLCHLGNIAYRSGKILQTDLETGHISDAEIMKKYWSRTYEPGWEPEI